MKATERYFPVMLFIMLYKVVLTFDSADEHLRCNHPNESYLAVLCCGTVCCTTFFKKISKMISVMCKAAPATHLCL